MGTMPSHDLSMLSDTDCWELIKQQAFGPNEEERPDLVIIGKEIVKKCGGVPLAAKALGSLLRFKRQEKEWRYVKESKLWSLQGENSVMPALRLSYLNLPVKLRQCFAFCALFPKDGIISKQFLIELWMANGFISSNEILEAQDIGSEVWNELHCRSFFQDTVTNEFGQIVCFKMHDLVHDLAQSIAEEICHITNDSGVPSLSERVRHLSIYRWNKLKEVGSIRLHCVESLKTCINHVDQLSPHVLRCYSLRVLDFERKEKLSSSIGRLKYLRYLNLSRGNFKTLPESLCTLWNLQILKLNNCQKLQKLPNSLVHLKALQHLYLRDCYSLSSLPPHVRMLASLKTLTLFVVGIKKGYLLAELGQMNLQGDLHIKHLERVKSVMNAKEANMSSKCVDNLKLSWDRNEESQLQENVEEILEVLQPQTQQLRSLGVRGYTGSCFPEWISSPTLKYLTSLQLVNCKSCLHLPHLGKLPSLKSLTVFNMSHVKYLDEESCDDGVAGGFICLEKLDLVKLPNLIILSRDDRENMLPHLSQLEIIECPKLLALPCLPSLIDMRISGKCNTGLLSSIQKLVSLESLMFSGNEELTCFPDGMLRNLNSLKKIQICRLSKLESFPTEIINLSAVEEICITDCENLKSLTDEELQGLHSLKRLSIVKYQKFNLSESFQYLTCLEELVIQSCSEIEVLHESLQHMTSLQLLTLCDLPNLASIPDWLGNLRLLQELNISQCPKLMCLPMSIQCLTGLKRLSIYSCSELEKRCKEKTGEDWPKIAHIQCIVVENIRTFYG